MKISFWRPVCYLLMTSCLITSCKKSEIVDNNGDGSNGPPPPPISVPFKITPIDRLNQGAEPVNSHSTVTSRSSLELNFRSYVNLGKDELGVSKPNYPRIKKLSNGHYILFYHNNQIGASCDYATSEDLKTWTHKGKIFKNYSIVDSKGENNERRYSNCNAIVLKNGDIIAVASYRANIGYREKPLDAGIEMRRSKDNGNSWGDPIEIYQGVNWEPFLLERASGEIQCYFTDSDSTLNESAYTGTAMITSSDGGNSWTPSFGSSPYFVIRTKHEKDGYIYFTDQMPAVIELNKNKELAAALEANVGSYYISFAYSGADGAWTHLSPDQEGPEDRNDNSFPGSGPYLVQFPSGETVLSYNYTSTFYMKMGDTSAHNFGQPYAPFSGKGFWGTMERIDSHQLIGAMPNTTQGEVMLSKFVLNHRITATNRNVQVDGNNAEWENTDQALFVGALSQAQATLRSSFNSDSVYFLVEVLDDFIDEDDEATIYLSTNSNSEKLEPNEGYRLKVSYDGLKSCEVYNNSGWSNTNLHIDARAAYKGTISDMSDQDEGYFVELAIARSKLNIKPGAPVLVNFSIKDVGQKEDGVADPTNTTTKKWVPLSGW
ncbi:sugar-binding protein [Arachidicoccus ginsenosidivorans]|nr:sugar-binding protein [Arachidicoccus ginsenosidivorans]